MCSDTEVNFFLEKEIFLYRRSSGQVPQQKDGKQPQTQPDQAGHHLVQGTVALLGEQSKHYIFAKCYIFTQLPPKMI